MRLLEWLILLSFLPILLMPIIPPRLRRALISVAPLPALIVVAHLLIEGWRVALIPLYMLAALVLVSRLPELAGRAVTPRRGRGLVVSAVIALTIVGCGIAAGWLVPVVTVPTATGPYAVGVVERELVDQARDRRLMASVWYPAAHDGPPAALTNHPDQVMTGLGNLSGLPELAYHHLRYSTVDASEHAPVHAEAEPFPVLIFSHGMVGLRLQNASTLQELASWGYVVVALDHTDAAAVTVLPDGETRYYDLARFGVPPDVEPTEALMTEHVLPVWVADQQFVYDTLDRWAADDPLFAGQLDLTRIGSFGHSFGGATALEVCRVDARCRASVNLDGGLYGEVLTQPTTRPLMLMTSAESSQFTESMREWTRMIESAAGAAYWLELPGSTHFSFTITQLLSPLLVPDGFDPRAGLGTIDKYLRAFFDRHLRGVETVPLDPTSGDVRWLTQAEQPPAR